MIQFLLQINVFTSSPIIAIALGGHNSNEGKMDGPDRESIKQRRVSRPKDLCSEGVCQCGYLTMEVIENKQIRNFLFY